MTATAQLVLRDSDDRPLVTLLFATLPAEPAGTEPESGVDAVGSPAIELVEETSYRYRLSMTRGVRLVSLEPSELFSPDTGAQRSGRIQTRAAVGEVEIVATVHKGAVRRQARAALIVRPSKLDEAAYHLMQQDLAAVAVELLHQGFAAPTARFQATGSGAPRLLYQQFAILYAALTSSELDRALTRILEHPYRGWTTLVEHRAPGMPLKGGGRLAQRLAAPGVRVALPNPAVVASIPRELPIERSETTLDCMPNRYVRFVLERWRALVDATGRAIRREMGKGGPKRRGIAQVTDALELLDTKLAHPTLHGVGTLRTFPQGNQVLLKHDGYRQVARVAALIEAAIGLDLTPEDDPFAISQRTVDTLYQYWCFVQLTRLLGEVCRRERTAELFRFSDDGISLKLKHDLDTPIRFTRVIDGRRIDVHLHYETTADRGGASWTEELRPDCSLKLRVHGPVRRDWWIHFDAKYRVRRSRPKRDGTKRADPEAADLVKMHAYRDGIRNSAGAFVLFPGRDEVEHRFDTEELLPGLGALVLSPGEPTSGAVRLREFLDGVMVQVANQTSRLERARFWSDVAYGEDARAVDGAELAAFVTRPPADTTVLLGFVKDSQHLEWVKENGTYNVRSGQRRGSVSPGDIELDARLLLLYNDDIMRPMLVHRRSGWWAATKAALAEQEYPEPRGEAYLCAAVEPVVAQPVWLNALDVGPLQPGDFGAPFVVSWLELMRQR